MAVLRFDLPDLCDCGRCGPKYVCGPVIEKRTRCGVVKKITYPTWTVANNCHTVALPQVYLDYQNMCDVWYGAPASIEVTKTSPLTYQIGIPPSMKGKLRVINPSPHIKVDMVQECPRRRKKEETYTINLRLDDEDC